MAIPQRLTGGAIDLGQLKKPAQQPVGASNAGSGAGAGATGEQVAPYFEVIEANFEESLVRRSAQVPVVVLIGTPRSEQSEQLRRDFQELAQAGGLKFLVGYLDADAQPQLAAAFGVRNLPTVVALAQGQPITNFEGAQPRAALEQWVTALVEQVGAQLPGLPAQEGADEEELDPRVREAEDALNQGDFAGAIAVYDKILAEDPKAVGIKQARDTTALLQRISGVEDPLGRAENDDSPQAQMDAADAEIVAGAPERAFDRLIAAIAAAAGDDKAALRTRLLELFGLFEPGDARVLAARTKLASALY